MGPVSYDVDVKRLHRRTREWLPKQALTAEMSFRICSAVRASPFATEKHIQQKVLRCKLGHKTCASAPFDGWSFDRRPFTPANRTSQTLFRRGSAVFCTVRSNCSPPGSRSSRRTSLSRYGCVPPQLKMEKAFRRKRTYVGRPCYGYGSTYKMVSQKCRRFRGLGKLN